MRLPGCCETPERRRLARALEDELARKTRLVVALGEEERLGSAFPGVRLAQVLQRARKLYIGMRMADARRLLLSSWRSQRESKGRGAKAVDLARLHAYLVAVYDAMGDAAAVARHSQAAMRYFPDLSLDDDVFTPSVQRALRLARAQRASLVVTVRPRPVQATVFWNGTSVGLSPVTLHDQAKGLHLLRISHPLFVEWAEPIELSTSVELQPQLVPRSPRQIGLNVSSRPDLAPLAVRLLETDGLLLLQAHPEGLVLTLFDATGKRSQLPLTDRRATGRVAVAACSRLGQRRVVRLPPTPAASLPATLPVREADTALAPDWADHLRHYWWAYALVGGAAVALGIVLPLSLGGGDAQQRDLVLEIP